MPVSLHVSMSIGDLSRVWRLARGERDCVGFDCGCKDEGASGKGTLG